MAEGELSVIRARLNSGIPRDNNKKAASGILAILWGHFLRYYLMICCRSSMVYVTSG